MKKIKKLFQNIIKYPKIRNCIHLIRLGSSPIRMLPNFLIISTQREVQTSLYNYLKKHPSILPSYRNVIYYFNENFNKSLYWYRSFFPIITYKNLLKKIFKIKIITGECTPDYMYYPPAAKRVYSILPNIKLIILLRNPVNRAYSHYYMNVRGGVEKLSFEEAIEKAKIIFDNEMKKMLEEAKYKRFYHAKYSYLARGLYINQIKSWLNYFPKEQVLILKSEDFFKNPQQILNKIYRFLISLFGNLKIIQYGN